MVRTRSSSAAAALRASSSSPNSNTSDPSSPAIAPGMASISASSNHNNNSISYLAPFVASVLRDQVVTDLLAESKRKEERIQQQAEDRLRLELTGRNGDLVYCKTSMKDGVGWPRSQPLWLVHFDPKDGNNTTIFPNFVETVPGLELRLGGVVVFKFDEAICVTATTENAGFDRTRDDEQKMRLVTFVNSDAGVRVSAYVGPIRYNDFVTVLPRRMHVTDLVQFLKDHQTNNTNNGSRALLSEIEIKMIGIQQSQIKGILPLLEDTMREQQQQQRILLERHFNNGG